MKPKVLRLIAWGLGLFVLLVAIGVVLFHGSLSRPFAGWDGEEVDVDLEAGLDAGSMLRRLADAGVIRDPLPLRVWLFWNGGSEALQAGEYRFVEPRTPLEVLARLQAGDVLLHAVDRLTYAHLETKSPWNTYVSPGLPPGPIANPGKASLEAAVQPAEGDELYFVAAPGGGHRFSRDLESHTRAVREWRNYLRSSR